MDKKVESVSKGERGVIGVDFGVDVGEGNRGEEKLLDRCGVKERNMEGKKAGEFLKRMRMALANTYFKEQHSVTYKSGGRCT